jgi:hypothetical protein
MHPLCITHRKRKVMKIGDIVEVHDGSYSLLCDGSGDPPAHVDGISLRRRRFRVLFIGPEMPTDYPRGIEVGLVKPNNLMLCEVKAPEHVLFTQIRFCTVVDRPAEVPIRAIVIVPFSMQVVTIREKKQ